MSRCIACNDTLPDRYGKKRNGDPEDLCPKCRYYALRTDDYIVKEYQLEHITDTAGSYRKGFTKYLE